MIACIAKNDRARVLFSRLETVDPDFRYLGLVAPDKRSRIIGAALSASASLRDTKRDSQWSPPVLKSMTDRCIELVEAQKDPIQALIYWGATNLPLDPDRHKFPYYIITDGPYDPDDSSYPVEWRPGKWRKSYLETQRSVFRGARHVFTLSEWARKKLIKVHGLSPESVTKMGWGPMMCIGEPRLEAVARPKVILSVGNEWHRKGMDLVAEAGSAIHASDPEVLTVIAGDPAGSSYAPRPGVSYLPHKVPGAAVQMLMREASVFVVASRFDASPHAIYEAMQYGTPVVGANVCGIPEAIDAPHGGRVVPELTAAALNASIKEVLQSDAAKSRRAAFDAYQASGGWEACVSILRHHVIEDLSKGS
jgi:glycosyltransferase involved in cell wall biosynthesis